MSFPQAIFLITPDEGTYPVTRCFIYAGTVRAGDRMDGRIGPGVVERVELRTRENPGCWIYTTRGTLFAPINNTHATWR